MNGDGGGGGGENVSVTTTKCYAGLLRACCNTYRWWCNQSIGAISGEGWGGERMI